MKTFLRISFFFMLVTQICFGQWVQVGLNDEVIKDIAVQNQNMFAVTSDSGKVFRSINGGANWTMIVDSCALDVDISPTGKVFMVRGSSLTSRPSALYSSLDNGVTWTLVEDLPYFSWDTIPRSISVSPVGYLFLGEFFGWGLGGRNGFAMSTDDGLVWIYPPPGNIRGGRLFDFNDQQAITYGTHGGPTTSGIYFYSSMDYGITWDSLYFPMPEQEMLFLFNLVTIGLFTNGDVIIGTEQLSNDSLYGVYISADLCSTWTQITKINCKSGLSWSSGSSEGLLIGTEDLGVFVFSDEGDSLGSRNEGLTNLNIHTLSLDNNGYVYAGTENGVWRRPLTDIVTSVKNEPTQPTEFILDQNYPNPFNPNTTISYSIPNSAKVELKVFNLLGQEITTLVNQEKPAGNYEVNFNASNLPSGVYIYKMNAGEYVQTRKMILLK